MVASWTYIYTTYDDLYFWRSSSIQNKAQHPTKTRVVTGFQEDVGKSRMARIQGGSLHSYKYTIGLYNPYTLLVEAPYFHF